MEKNDSRAILIVGASGKLGGTLLRLLEGKGVAVRAATRTPNEHSPVAPSTRWVHFDLDRTETFRPALEGVHGVLLMARPGDEHPEVSSMPLITAMKHTGVRCVVNVTAMGTELRPDFGLRKVELALEASGLAFTHLRPNFFMQIFTSGPHHAQIMSRRQIRLPAADARISFIDVADIAEVAERCLFDPVHRNQAYTLTGGAGLAHDDIARFISGVTDRPVSYVPLDEEGARSEWSAAGLPQQNVERLIAFYRIVRTGAAAAVSPFVEQILGRKPNAFSDFVTRSAACWQ